LRAAGKAIMHSAKNAPSIRGVDGLPKIYCTYRPQRKWQQGSASVLKETRRQKGCVICLQCTKRVVPF